MGWQNWDNNAKNNKGRSYKRQESEGESGGEREHDVLDLIVDFLIESAVRSVREGRDAFVSVRDAVHQQDAAERKRETEVDDSKRQRRTTCLFLIWFWFKSVGRFTDASDHVMASLPRLQ